MDILIIGSGNEKIVKKIREIADMEYDISVHELDLSEMVKPLISAFRTGAYSSEYIMKLVRKIAEKELSKEGPSIEDVSEYSNAYGEFIKGHPTIEIPELRRGKSGIIGLLKEKIMPILATPDNNPTVKLNDNCFKIVGPSTPPKICIVVDLFGMADVGVPIKAAKEPNPFEFSGYDHTFGKRLFFKREEDKENINNLSSVHNHRSKSIIKQSHINGKPIIYRRHGKDNRR